MPPENAKGLQVCEMLMNEEEVKENETKHEKHVEKLVHKNPGYRRIWDVYGVYMRGFMNTRSRRESRISILV